MDNTNFDRLYLMFGLNVGVLPAHEHVGNTPKIVHNLGIYSWVGCNRHYTPAIMVQVGHALNKQNQVKKVLTTTRINSNFEITVWIKREPPAFQTDMRNTDKARDGIRLWQARFAFFFSLRCIKDWTKNPKSGLPDISKFAAKLFFH